MGRGGGTHQFFDERDEREQVLLDRDVEFILVLEIDGDYLALEYVPVKYIIGEIERPYR